MRYLDRKNKRSPGVLKTRLRLGKKGQGALEFAALLPLVMLLFLAVIQFGVVLYAQHVVTGAAQEGARVASEADKGPNDGIAAAQSQLQKGLGSVRISVQGEDDGDKVYIRAEAVVPTFLPFLDKKIRFNLKANAEMLKEKWRS